MFTRYSKYEVFSILKQYMEMDYITRKMRKSGISEKDLAYTPPELLPQITSDQILSQIRLQIELMYCSNDNLDYVIDKIKCEIESMDPDMYGIYE